MALRSSSAVAPPTGSEGEPAPTGGAPSPELTEDEAAGSAAALSQPRRSPSSSTRPGETQRERSARQRSRARRARRDGRTRGERTRTGDEPVIERPRWTGLTDEERLDHRRRPGGPDSPSTRPREPSVARDQSDSACFVTACFVTIPPIADDNSPSVRLRAVRMVLRRDARHALSREDAVARGLVRRKNVRAGGAGVGRSRTCT